MFCNGSTLHPVFQERIIALKAACSTKQIAEASALKVYQEHDAAATEDLRLKSITTTKEHFLAQVYALFHKRW